MSVEQENAALPADVFKKVAEIGEEMCRLINEVQSCAAAICHRLEPHPGFIERANEIGRIAAAVAASNAAAPSAGDAGRNSEPAAMCSEPFASAVHAASSLAEFSSKAEALFGRLNTPELALAFNAVYEELLQYYRSEYRWPGAPLACIHRVGSELRTATNLAKQLVSVQAEAKDAEASRRSSQCADEAEKADDRQFRNARDFDNHLDIVLDDDGLYEDMPPIWFEMRMCRKATDVASAWWREHLIGQTRAASAHPEPLDDDEMLQVLLGLRDKLEHESLRILWTSLGAKYRQKQALYEVAKTEGGADIRQLKREVWNDPEQSKEDKEDVIETTMNRRLFKNIQDGFAQHGYELEFQDNKRWKLVWRPLPQVEGKHE